MLSVFLHLRKKF